MAVLGIGAAAGAAEPNPGPGGAAMAAPCEYSALALRQVNAGGPGSDGLFALKNRGDAVCRITGSAGIRLFDAAGEPIPLEFAPRTMMAMLLTLEPGAEASFTVSFATDVQAPQHCVTAARIEVTLAPQLAPASAPPLSAKTSLIACNPGPVRVSNLRLGVPRPPIDNFG